MQKIIYVTLLFALAACVPETVQQPTVEVAQVESPTSSPVRPTSTSAPDPIPEMIPSAELPQFEPAECAFSPPYLSYVECGYLIVPEDRNRPDGPTIRLHVAIAKSFASEPETDPLIYLSGGPGSWSLEWLFGNITKYADILKSRDVIFFDPRGVGYSEPSLDCPEVLEVFRETQALAISHQEWVDYQVEANRACRDRLVADGIDLAAYNSGSMAADVKDLQMALGYNQVNLMGISYGTRTALTVMRDYPEAIRSVILDSVVPIEENLLGADAVSADQALDIIFQRCEADPNCNDAFPDLQKSLDETAEKLDANPITIQVTNLLTNKKHDVYVDGSLFGWSIVEALYNYETAIYLPKLIHDTSLGEDEEYSTLATSLEIYLLYGEISSEGMRNSVLCSDEVSFSTLDAAIKKTEGVVPALADFFAKDLSMLFHICEEWGAEAADPIENLPVITDIPTLVMSGEYDPVTPPAWGMAVADNLRNAHFIEFPGLGHSVFSERRCPRDIVAEFLAAPDTNPDSTCAQQIRFDFVTR